MRRALGMLASLYITVPLQPASALDPTKALTQYVHSVWRAEDGLPHTSVMRVLQSRDGYLWIGTQNGVSRFDGVRFTVFSRKTTESLHDSWISDLAEDPSGVLWIATSHGGLSYFWNGRFYHLTGIADRAARTLAIDIDGSLWVGGAGGIAHVRNRQVLRRYTAAEGLSDDVVTRLKIDRDRSLWIATAAGLDHLSGGKIKSLSVKDGLPNNDVLDLYLDAAGALLVKTQNSELVRLVHGHFEPWRVAGVAGANIHDMLEDHDGNLWLGSTTQGLLRVKGKAISRFTVKDGLSNDEVMCLYEDRDGNVWIGSNEGGLDRLHNGYVTTFAKEEGFADDRTHSVIQDSSGNIWATTASGLNQLNGNKSRVLTTANGLPSNNVLALGADDKKHLLISTLRNGLVRLADEHFEKLPISGGPLPPYAVSSILNDDRGRLWLATLGGGLAFISDKTVRVVNKSSGLLSNVLYALAKGQDGTIWVATKEGLNGIQNGVITSYLGKDGPGRASVITAYVDTRNVLWLGTIDRGLFRLENGRFTDYTTREGLADDTIGNIVEDNAANLWIGSNKGISRLDRHDLDAVAIGTRENVRPIVFGKADGMKTADLNAGTQPNAWRAHDGRLWFPTTRGIVVVNPALISFDRRPPNPRVEEVVADDIPLDLTSPLRLAPETRRLEIRYTAPELSSPERLRFRYRLDGFDDGWIAGRPSRTADYANLSPGRYTFHVGAQLEAGGWTNQDVAVSFVMLPKYYQTWWFRMLCGVAGMSVIWTAYRLRVNLLHARTAVLEERQRIAREIHDSLAQGLSGIIFQTEAALLSMKRAPERLSEHLTSAREMAMSSLDDARYSVANLSTPAHDQKDLEDSLLFMARQLARGRIENLQVQSSGAPWTIRPAAAHHIMLLAQEAVSNAVQHGRAKTITIDLTYSTETMLLRVVDDGVGFTEGNELPNPGRGYGMQNMHHRAGRLGARLEVISKVGQGTVVSLSATRLGGFARLWRGLLGTAVARIER
jgi:ligand-binding sensor domain-containing protein/signal transduction histidine kinase